MWKIDTVPDKLNLNAIPAYSDEVLKFIIKKLQKELKKRKELREWEASKEYAFGEGSERN